MNDGVVVAAAVVFVDWTVAPTQPFVELKLIADEATESNLHDGVVVAAAVVFVDLTAAATPAFVVFVALGAAGIAWSATPYSSPVDLNVLTFRGFFLYIKDKKFQKTTLLKHRMKAALIWAAGMKCKVLSRITVETTFPSKNHYSKKWKRAL